MKHTFVFGWILLSHTVFTQINAEKFHITINSELNDSMQRIFTHFLNNEVERVSIVRLKKAYDQDKYESFLKTKKVFQSRKKWIKKNSYEESMILEGNPYPKKHFDSIVFEYEFRGVDKKRIQLEHFLESTEIKSALNEAFNGDKPEIYTSCYNPRHAILFYDKKGEISGVYEICFECSQVKIGIIGTALFSKSNPYLKSLFEEYNMIN